MAMKYAKTVLIAALFMTGACKHSQKLATPASSAHDDVYCGPNAGLYLNADALEKALVQVDPTKAILMKYKDPVRGYTFDRPNLSYEQTDAPRELRSFDMDETIYGYVKVRVSGNHVIDVKAADRTADGREYIRGKDGDWQTMRLTRALGLTKNNPELFNKAVDLGVKDGMAEFVAGTLQKGHFVSIATANQDRDQIRAVLEHLFPDSHHKIMVVSRSIGNSASPDNKNEYVLEAYNHFKQYGPINKVMLFDDNPKNAADFISLNGTLGPDVIVDSRQAEPFSPVVEYAGAENVKLAEVEVHSQLGEWHREIALLQNQIETLRAKEVQALESARPLSPVEVTEIDQLEQSIVKTVKAQSAYIKGELPAPTFPRFSEIQAEVLAASKSKAAALQSSRDAISARTQINAEAKRIVTIQPIDPLQASYVRKDLIAQTSNGRGLLQNQDITLRPGTTDIDPGKVPTVERSSLLGRLFKGLRLAEAETSCVDLSK